MYGGAEGSIVLQPVQECSDSLRQRRLQLRDVTLEFRIRKTGATTLGREFYAILPFTLKGNVKNPLSCM